MSEPDYTVVPMPVRLEYLVSAGRMYSKYLQALARKRNGSARVAAASCAPSESVAQAQRNATCDLDASTHRCVRNAQRRSDAQRHRFEAASRARFESIRSRAPVDAELFVQAP